jgi:hypothetical protein
VISIRFGHKIGSDIYMTRETYLYNHLTFKKKSKTFIENYFIELSPIFEDTMLIRPLLKIFLCSDSRTRYLIQSSTITDMVF